MSGFTEQVRTFDQFLSAKYSLLKIDAQRICGNAENFEDVLGDCIVKVRERISKSGFTGNNYHGYLWMGISNSYKVQKKRESRRLYFDFGDPTIQTDVYSYLDEQAHDSQNFYDSLDILCKYLFKYITIHYNERQCTLFKTYFLTRTNSYHKLVEASGLTPKYVKETILTIKRDLRLNLINYIKYELTPEIWRPVKNYEGLYEVSNKKRVRNRYQNIVYPDYKEIYGLWNNGERKYKSLSEQILKGAFRPEDQITYNRQEVQNDSKRRNKAASRKRIQPEQMQ